MEDDNALVNEEKLRALAVELRQEMAREAAEAKAFAVTQAAKSGRRLIGALGLIVTLLTMAGLLGLQSIESEATTSVEKAGDGSSLLDSDRDVISGPWLQCEPIRKPLDRKGSATIQCPRSGQWITGGGFALAGTPNPGNIDRAGLMPPSWRGGPVQNTWRCDATGTAGDCYAICCDLARPKATDQ